MSDERRCTFVELLCSICREGLLSRTGKDHASDLRQDEVIEAKMVKELCESCASKVRLPELPIDRRRTA